MPDIDAKKIEELRGLLAKATPGPWKNHLVDDTTIVASNGFEIGTTWPGGSVYNGFVDPAEQHEINAALIVAMRNALPALLDLAPKALATLSLAGEDARPEDRAEQFIQAAVDSAPEPLRRLGEWLANKLDDDDWKTAERLLNGASVEARSLSLRVEAEKRAAFDTAHANYLPEDKSNASWKAEMMRRFDENWTLRMQATVRAESAETHSAALARALEEARDELLECKADYHRNPSSVIDKCNAVLTERDAGNEMIDRAEEAFEAKRAAEAHSAELAKVLENILDTYRRVYYMPKPGDGKLMWKAIDEARSLLASKEDTANG